LADEGPRESPHANSLTRDRCRARLFGSWSRRSLARDWIADVEVVPPRQVHRYRSDVRTEARLQLIEQREGKLVERYRRWLAARQIHADALRIRFEPPASPLLTDLYIPSRRQLVEAKGSIDREDIRMAIGELADYEFWLRQRPPWQRWLRKAILLPGQPPDDIA
jgi:hypothetical protein